MEADEEVAAAAEGYDGGGGGGAGAGRKEEEERRKTKSKFDERKKNEKEARREEETRRASSTRMNPKPKTLCPCLRWVKLFDGHRRSKWSARSLAHLAVFKRKLREKNRDAVVEDSRFSWYPS